MRISMRILENFAKFSRRTLKERNSAISGSADFAARIIQSSVVVFLALVLILPLGMAVNLNVEVTPVKDVVVVGVDDTIKYGISVENNGEGDNFQIYSLIESDFQPKDFFRMEEGDSKDLDVVIKLSDRTLRDVRGPYVFSYEIMGMGSGYFNGKLTARVLEIQDVFEVKELRFDPTDEFALLRIENIIDRKFSNVSFSVESEFFEHVFSKDFSGLEEAEISIPVEGDSKLVAGEYLVKTEIGFGDVEGIIESELKYLEEGGLSTFEETTGGIVRKTKVIKTNEGNVVNVAEIEGRKNILTRLLTTHSVRPERVEKSGFFVTYYWSRDLEPGDSFVVVTSTNYTVPFVLLIVVILIVIGARLYFRGSLLLEKRVNFVKTKGGEFALKVKIKVRARKHVNNVQIVDRLPRVTKLYEKFGRKPDRVDHKTRKIYWDVHNLNKGESRVFSYIIYSKMKILGRFELPSAMAVYQRNGTTEEAYSNKTSFAAESSSERREED